MQLSRGIIRPGTVVEVLENGAVKATAPGLFAYTDEPDKLPPIMPWMVGSNSNSFSQLKQYDDIWILNFSDNPRQLYWFRKDNVASNENVPIGETDVEILCNREVGGEWCTIHFSNGSGWVIGKGESIINITADGTICLDTSLPNRCIDINNDNISIGTRGNSAHPVAFGDETENVIMEICKLLNSVANTALGNPYTAAIGSTLMSSVPSIISKIPNISSRHVTVD